MPFAPANVCADRQPGCTAQCCVDNTGHPRVLAMFWAKADRCHRVCLLRQPSPNESTAAMCVRAYLGDIFVALWCLLCNQLLGGYPHSYPSALTELHHLRGHSGDAQDAVQSIDNLPETDCSTQELACSSRWTGNRRPLTWEKVTTTTVKVGYNNYTCPQVFCPYIQMSLVGSSDLRYTHVLTTEASCILPECLVISNANNCE